MKRSTNFLLVMLLVSSTLAVLPSAASDYTLGIFGNANMDDMIDEDDIAYVEGIIEGTNERTELADANYDGEVDEDDITQIELIICGEEKELTIIDSADRIVTVNKPINKIIVINSDIVETMRSIKATEEIIGVGKYMIDKKTFFPEFGDYPNVGKTTAPDCEKILELQPDAVFFYATIWTSQLDEVQNTLESADPNIKVVRFDCFKPESYMEEVKKAWLPSWKKRRS
ncbi:MAG: hypothetical protein U9N48_05635 [Euryarchaeota archaeon]|nr:hypothetical protein [Euryarchaeota archaeon]